MNRRSFLKFLGMASSATVLSSCGVEKSTEKIIPLLVPHEEPDYLPGEPMFRNSVCTECNAGCGVNVRLVEFNAIKLDGIKGHPVNDGALCIRGQSSLMRLYHPNRIKTPLIRTAPATEMERLEGKSYEQISWQKAYEMINAELKKANNNGKQNVYLSGKVTGSTKSLLDDFSTKANVESVTYEPFAHANLRAAYQNLFERDEIPTYRIDKADFLLTIGADVIETFLNPVSYSIQIEKSRKLNNLKWMHAEPHASLTGYKADSVAKVKPGSEVYLLGYLLNNMSASLPRDVRDQIPVVSAGKATQETGLSADQLTAIVQAFQKARNPLLIAGGVSTEQANGYSVAVMAALIQSASNMVNNTVDFSNAEETVAVGNAKDIANLAARLKRNSVGVLFISNTNPMKTAPVETGFAESHSNASFKVAITDFHNESTEDCDLILPASHTFESWGDYELRRGVTGFSKPVLKEKLFNTQSEGEILYGLTEMMQPSANTITFEQWIENRWQKMYGSEVNTLLEKGFVTSSETINVSLKSSEAVSALRNLGFGKSGGGQVAYVVPSIRTFDGRSGILPLAYEIPDPLTTISYGEWVSVSKENVESLALENDSLVNKAREVVNVNTGNGAKELAAFVQPGLPKDIYTMQRDMVSPAMLSFDKNTGEIYSRYDAVNVTNTGTKREIAVLAGDIDQGHRNIVRNDHPHDIPWLKGDESLYPDMNEYYPTYRWGISVDMQSCTGCSACVAACYIENNIPVVGEKEHITGREMAWLRVQPYYFEDGTMDNLIMMCQHCDYAPCENVCPVYATYHNEEGLNVMVYNRCVGTRYCFNNCPYKVRRFNWFDWTDQGAWAEPMMRMTNPDIWVRPKGVMEKCTFCIQRIRRGKDHAKDEGRLVRDGEIRTACQEACPTDAITFGNMKDTNSEVYKKSQSNRKFRVLEGLGVGPAVHYLRKEEQA